ncbi:MAG: HD domain-containing protein [Lachnospiraceae bacterium]|nr:HD domain-containing protein [Lachnospiraceae bacterium]
MISEKEEFDRYLERMSKIRELSSPPLYDFDDAGDYSRRLKNNFEIIGKLAGENRQMLENVLFPILAANEILKKELTRDLIEFAEKLLSLAEEVTDFENLDLPIMDLVGEKLAENALKCDSLEDQIVAYDAALLANYSMMNMTERIFADQSISDKFKKRGIEIGNIFLDLVENKDRFLSVKDPELRGLTLTNARFMTCMYERATDRQENELYLDLLEKMLRISEDPFYIEAVPDFDWKYFKFRALCYMLQSTDIGNIRQFSKEQIVRVVHAADRFEALVATDPEYFKGINGYSAIQFMCARNRYYLGIITEKEYRRSLLEVYDERNPEDFSADGAFANILALLEILLLLKDRVLSETDRKLVIKLTRDISAYMFHMPNAGALTFAMEYFAEIVQNFTELPGGITFEDFALQSLAALHPPTYIHSVMVGKIASCLVSYLADKSPELLTGILDCRDEEEVIRKREEICRFTYHAGICHDFGKIPIIDTIFVYGRKLLDDEFAIIKTHPKAGYEMLLKYESTRAYAQVALGHHRFFDDSKGYPPEFKTADSPLKTIIDVVQCADCMDAATDSVGRSYNKGKTIDDFIREVEEGSGTRYAPWLAGLIRQEDARNDLERLLSVGREETYRETYLLLKSVKENAGQAAVNKDMRSENE